ncbi:hypothetical protein AAF712_013745 [Marasmius tenuissimus]|uniref:PBP domain-containing protein n=1 Tax=Marasmius tenuissimus TaxID=585030 RepID=A0ABR2ZEU7_9AGAR
MQLKPEQLLVPSTSPGDVLSQSSSTAPVPKAVYNGGYQDASEILLRVANGGAGQSGLVEALANAFIKYSVENESTPFLVAWILGDTTESLDYIAARQADVALTYNDAAETQSIASGASVKKDLVFFDHFYLVGPRSNPAHLSSTDTVSQIFNKIVASGKADEDNPPKDRPATRFLSRFDKSATNIKDSELFIRIGQVDSFLSLLAYSGSRTIYKVPWAQTASTWYHKYPHYPLEALEEASTKSEYTITDKGTWLSSPTSVTDKLAIYKGGNESTTTSGGSNDDATLLLNPCTAVLSAHPSNQGVAESFMSWLVSKDGGQKVVGEFKNKDGKVLYTPVVV